MAVFAGSIEIEEVYVGAFPIGVIYIGPNMVWQYEEVPPEPTDRTACFPGGIWDDTLTWDDDEIWVDNL